MRMLAAMSLILATQGGCTLFLEYELSGLDCDPQRRCLEHSSCLVNSCIVDHSKQLDETCNLTRQCQEGLICPSRAFSCRPACQYLYQADPSCAADPATYCAPVRSADGSSFLGQGFCQDSECTTVADCRTGTACVPMKGEVSFCFTACSYSLTLDGGQWNYRDTAGDLACHPVGDTGQEAMVSWPVGVQGLGEACDPVTSPCQRGLACIRGASSLLRCHALCQCQNMGNSCWGCPEAQACVYTGAYAYCLPQ